ncbi:hypothetical protein BGZ76_004241, partial [Entomortierella beljakovae]
MNSFSFTAIPLGLGLSTLAHLHLCNRNLAQAENERRRCIALSERYQINNFLQSCNEKALLSELIHLLEQTLHISEDTSLLHTSTQIRANHRHSQESSFSSTTSSLINHKKSQRTFTKANDTSHISSTVTNSNFGVDNEELCLSSTLSSSTHGNIRPKNGQLKDGENIQRIGGQANSPENSSTVISAVINGNSTISSISLEQVELWIKACMELRKSQEKVLKTLSEVDIPGRSEDTSIWGLKVN